MSDHHNLQSFCWPHGIKIAWVLNEILASFPPMTSRWRNPLHMIMGIHKSAECITKCRADFKTLWWPKNDQHLIIQWPLLEKQYLEVEAHALEHSCSELPISCNENISCVMFFFIVLPFTNFVCLPFLSAVGQSVRVRNVSGSALILKDFFFPMFSYIVYMFI